MLFPSALLSAGVSVPEWVSLGIAVVSAPLSFRWCVRRRVFTACGRVVPSSATAPSWMFGAVSLWLVFAAVYSFLAGGDVLCGVKPEIAAQAQRFWMTYAATMLCAAGGLLFVRRQVACAGFGLSWRDIPVGAWSLLLTIPWVYMVGVAGTVLSVWFSGDVPAPVAHESLSRLVSAELTAGWWAFALVLVVGPAVVEELIFRFGAQTALRAAGLPGWVSVVGTSAVFALVHLGAAEPRALPSLFVLSLGFGFAFERTGRICVPMVMHALFNGSNIVVARLFLSV